jgi:hypothetical protein
VVLTLEESMSILKLAKKWDLASVRNKAVAQSDIEIQKKTPVEKILLAKQYGVTQWLQEGYRSLVSRENTITDEERDQLGLETFARLMVAREKSFAWALKVSPSSTTSKGCSHSIYCNHCRRNTLCSSRTQVLDNVSRETFAYDATIRDLFGGELKA